MKRFVLILLALFLVFAAGCNKRRCKCKIIVSGSAEYIYKCLEDCSTHPDCEDVGPCEE